MSDSISQLLTGLAEGDGDAAQKFWDEYFQRMVRLARRKLWIRDVPRGDVDEEDIAADAVSDFYEEAKERKFENVHKEIDLWKILFTFTVRKVTKRQRYHFSQKRGGGQVRYESDIKLSEDEDLQNEYARGTGILSARILTPEQEAILNDSCRQLLEQLPDETQRQIMTMKWDGYRTKEIADKLGCTDQTIRNNLDKMRHNLLVYMMGTDPTRALLDNLVEEYKSLLNKLKDDLRGIAEDWLKGRTPQEIANKLECTPAVINRKLARIAHTWEEIGGRK